MSAPVPVPGANLTLGQIPPPSPNLSLGPVVGKVAALNVAPPPQLPAPPPPPLNWQTPQRTFRLNEKAWETQWLASEGTWKNRVGKGWVANRVLGKGGYGIVGHWEYKGPDRNLKPLKDVVVKQATTYRAGRRKGAGLKSEDEFLQMFLATKTRHIVRIFRRMYSDVGAGTPRLEPDPPDQEVHRIFLEFCPGGDLNNFFDRKLRDSQITSTPPFSEVELWMIFHCLARAVMVMHSGSEEYGSWVKRWDKAEMVHFDLKPGNILVGAKTTDEEHQDNPAFKVADFGLAEWAANEQNSEYLEKRQTNGTRMFLLPEQIPGGRVPVPVKGQKDYIRPWQKLYANKIKTRRYNTASNIWQVGAIMHCLLRKQTQPIWMYMQVYNSKLSNHLKNNAGTLGLVVDVEEEIGKKTPLYSKGLRALIAETLLVNPSDRVAVRELASRTKIGLDVARKNAGPGSINSPGGLFTPEDEPMLDPGWYSGQFDHPYYAAAQDLLKAQAAANGAANQGTTPATIDAAAAIEAAATTFRQQGTPIPEDIVVAQLVAGNLAEANARFAQWRDEKATKDQEKQARRDKKEKNRQDALAARARLLVAAKAGVANPGNPLGMNPLQPPIQPPPPGQGGAQAVLNAVAAAPNPPLPNNLISMTFIVTRKDTWWGLVKKLPQSYTINNVPTSYTIGNAKAYISRWVGIPADKLQIIGFNRETMDYEQLALFVSRHKTMRVNEL